MQNHVWLEKRANSKSGLLTPAEEQHKIRELLGDRFVHGGRLFHPEHTFFELESEEQLLQSARQLFVWLGVKPGHIEIKYGDLKIPGIYTEDPGMKRLIINQKLHKYPFQCAAVLTHLVMHAILNGRRRYIVEDPLENESFINQAIIEAGLGLAVVNGLAPVHPWHRLIMKKEIDPRGYFPAVSHFIQGFASHISKYRIHHEEYGQYLAPWIENFLPESLRTRVTVRNAPAVYISATMARQKRMIAKLTAMLFVFIIFAGAVSYAFRSGSNSPSPEQLEQVQKISELKSSYDSCTDSLQKMRRKLDHNDIFQQRVIDEQISRCTSLRNEYNSLADTYNRGLGE